MKRSRADILREYGPFPGVDGVHGVTYDGQYVVRVRRQAECARPGARHDVRSLDVAAHAGGVRRPPSVPDRRGPHREDRSRIGPRARDDPRSRQRRRFRAGGRKARCGSASTANARFIRWTRKRAPCCTIESNRFVTGVTWVDGELWHGTWEADQADLRHIDPRTGQVLEQIDMPAGVGVSGLESDGHDRFCGGGSSGTLRAVRRPARAGASGQRRRTARFG